MSEEIEKPDASIEDQLDDNQIRCLLTDEPVKATEKEKILQSLIRMLNEEYGFDLPDMERDVTVTGEDGEGKKWKRKVELVAFPPKEMHQQSNIIRLCIVTDPKTKETDKKNGVENALENALRIADGCEFGIWTNGLRFSYLQKRTRGLQTVFDELADFPGAGESVEDLDRSDRPTARVPANDSLIRTFKRSALRGVRHDHPDRRAWCFHQAHTAE
jgi:type I restriction enzyme M protein